VAESSRSTPAPLARALDLSRRALREEPAGLLTDFDGTLSPIVADPGNARLADGAADALEALVDRLAVVAVVTGRAPLDARRMTGVPGLLVAGNHGTEWLEAGAETPVTSPDAVRVRHLLAGVLDRVPGIDGVTVEDKGISATVHYRNAADPDGARDALLRALGGMPHGLELRRGRMSLELRPVGLGDKGAATRAIIERHGLRGVVVMGDDITDLDMFAAVDELRVAGRLRGAIIGVGGADAEVSSEVIAASDVVLASPAEAAALLVALGDPDR
jgi:trehalose 6-phosphate phosphatase